jgi:hypothetical protein
LQEDLQTVCIVTQQRLVRLVACTVTLLLLLLLLLLGRGMVGVWLLGTAAATWVPDMERAAITMQQQQQDSSSSTSTMHSSSSTMLLALLEVEGVALLMKQQQQQGWAITIITIIVPHI